MIPGGYILLARKIIESEIWLKPPLYLKVWIYLLTRAQHKPYKGLQKGQLVTSIPEICEECKWKVGYREVKPSKDSVFQAIDWMRKTSSTKATPEATPEATMIAIARATQRIIVTIDKYCVYQDPKLYEGNGDSNNEGEAKATTTHHNINKNDKNDKNERKEHIPASGYDYFSDFWAEYPKKVAKADAAKAFAKLKMNDDLMELVMAGLFRAIDSEAWRKDDGKFIPYPASWIRGERWKDGT